MLEERRIAAERVEVLSDGSLQIRDATVIVRDGETDASFPAKYHRYVLHPGTDLAGQPDKVAAVAAAIWTENVIAAFEAAYQQRAGESQGG